MHKKLTQIQVRPNNGRAPDGLKGRCFTINYSGCDIIVGPNGAGKTTRGPLAVVALLEGLAERPTDTRRPWVGSVPQATEIVGTFSTGETITRDLSALRGKAKESADQQARDVAGLTPTAWDLSDFASGTDGDRGKILDAAARAGGAIAAWDATTAQDHVRGLLTEDSFAVLDRCIKQHPNSPTGADFLKAAVIWTEVQQTTTNAAQKAAEAHERKLREAIPHVVDGDAQADIVERDRLLSRRARIKAQVEDAAKVAAAIRRHEEEGARLTAELALRVEEGQRLKAPLVAPDLTVPADVAARLVAAQANMIVAIPSPDVDVEALRKAADAITVPDTSAAVTADDAAQAINVSAANTRAAASAAVQAAQSNLATLRSLGGTDAVCVHCGAHDPSDVGPRIRAAEEAVEAARADAVKALELAESASAAAKVTASARSAAEAAARTATAALSTARARLEAATASLAGHTARVQAERERNLEAAKAALAREQAASATRKANYEKAVDQQVKDVAAARARWTQTKALLDAWTATPAPAAIDQQDDDTAAPLAEVQARIDLRTARENSIGQAKEASAAYLTAKATWDATRALVDAVRQARDDLAAAAYGPINNAARELLVDTVGLPIPFFRGPDDYGATIDGVDVQFAGLSESEGRISAAAFVYAIATVAGNPCRLVLIDGIEVVQQDHRAPLLAALSSAVQAGKVDNVICTMATAPWETVPEVDGLVVHVVEKAAVQVSLPVATYNSDEAPF